MIKKLYEYCSRIKGVKLFILLGTVAILAISARIFDHQSRTKLMDNNINMAALNLTSDDIKAWHSELDFRQKLETKRCCNEKFETNTSIAVLPARYAGQLSLLLDLLFSIAFFVLMLRFLFYLKGPWDQWAGRSLKIALYAVFIILGAEIIENISIFYLTMYANRLLLNIAYMATVVKLLSYILFIGLNLDFVSEFFTKIFNVLLVNLIQTVTLILLYVIFFVSDQGQNLLINLNSSSLAVLIFLFIVSFFAALNWHISKFFQNKLTASAEPLTNFYTNYDWADADSTHRLKNKFNSEESDNTNLHRNDKNYRNFYISVPRMFGVLVLLIPACALIHLTMLGNPASLLAQLIDAHSIMFICIIAFYYCFHKRLFEKLFYNKKQKFMNYIMAGFAFVFIVIGMMNDSSVWSIKFLSLSLFFLALLFAIVSSVRNTIATDTQKPFKFCYMDMSGGRINKSLFWISVLMLLTMLAFVIISFTGPVLYNKFIFPVVSVIFVSYEVIITALVIMKWRTKINFPVIALIAIIITFGLINNNTYKLRQGTKLSATETVPEIDKYIDEWIDARKEKIIKSKNDYPVFFINGYGGGIRASAYFYMVVRELDMQYRDSFKESFFPHVFSFSTASGSSLGAVCAVSDMARSEKMLLKDSASFSAFIQQDFLSPVLIGLLAGDGFSRFSDNIPDRDELQERTWEKQDTFLARNYFELYTKNKNRQLPALLFNISESQKSQSVLLAPFDFEGRKMSGRICANKLLGTRNINLSTAALLTARFPVISPAAHTDGNNYLHDGGITENSAIRSNLEVYRAIKKRIAYRIKRYPSQKAWLEKISFRFISVNNTMSTEDPPKEELSQSGSLLKIIAGTGITGNSNRAVEETRVEAMNSGAAFFALRVNENCIGIMRPSPWKQILGDSLLYIKTILPLGWQLSEMATQKLDRSAHEEVSKIIYFR